MIHLFDDREERRKEYEVFLRKYKDFIQVTTFSSGVMDLESFILNTFQENDIVLLHYSYRFPIGNYGITDILNAMKLLDISIILFSGAFRQASIVSIPHRHYRLNSSIMYRNLQNYIRNKSKGNLPPLETLIWGENYVKNQLLSLMFEITGMGCNVALDTIIASDDMEEVEFLIRERLNSKFLQEEMSGLIEFVEEESPKTYLEVLDKIQSLLKG